MHFLWVHSVHGSFWFSKFHFRLILGQKFSLIFFTQLFLIVVHFDLLMSRPHIRMLLQVLLGLYIFLVLNFSIINVHCSYFGFSIFKCSQNSSHLTLQVYHYFCVQSVPHLRQLSYSGKSFHISHWLEVCVTYFQPSYRSCFRLAVVFKMLAAEILLHCWK